MKKLVLMIGLVWCGVIIPKHANTDDATFLDQVDLIIRTRKVQQEGGATIKDLRVAVDIASGDYEQEAEQTWWEAHPKSTNVVCFMAGVAVSSLYFLNSR